MLVAGRNKSVKATNSVKNRLFAFIKRMFGLNPLSLHVPSANVRQSGWSCNPYEDEPQINASLQVADHVKVLFSGEFSSFVDAEMQAFV
jgi:hypothetical protein